jgi:hypothetical protein
MAFELQRPLDGSAPPRSILETHHQTALGLAADQPETSGHHGHPHMVQTLQVRAHDTVLAPHRPPQEQSRASRKASFRTLKSLTCTGVLGTVIMMTHTHRGTGLSATEDLVRKFAHSERQTPRSAPRGIVQGRNMTQVGSYPRPRWQRRGREPYL